MLSRYSGQLQDTYSSVTITHLRSGYDNVGAPFRSRKSKAKFFPIGLKREETLRLRLEGCYSAN